MDFKKILLSGFFIGGFSLVLTHGVMAGETITIQEHVPISKDAGATPEVQKECNLETKLPNFVEEYAKNAFKVEVKDNLPKAGKSLKLEITDVQGKGGGAWSGSKSVSVKGTLLNNGKAVASFKARRYSGGGAFAGYKGTCSILGRCVKALGKDIATWLADPKNDARLGDL